MKNENPIVSVVMPCYNGEKYIEDAIKSIIIQDIPLEIIFIDDFSNDKTYEIMQNYIKKYDFIKYFKNEKSLGVAKSRNKGVLLSEGKYIAFLDADDIWEKDKLKKQIKLIEKINAVLVFSARLLINDSGEDTKKIIYVPEKITYRELLKTNPIPCSSVLILKNVAMEFPMRGSKLHEDYLNWLEILKKYNVAYGINEPLLKYRLSPNGKSRNKFKSIIMTYKVHRELKSNVFISMYYTFSHILRSLKKYSINKG